MRVRLNPYRMGRRKLAVNAATKRHRRKFCVKYIRQLLEEYRGFTRMKLGALGGPARLEACRNHLFKVYGSYDRFVISAWPNCEHEYACDFGGVDDIRSIWPLRVRIKIVEFLRAYEPSSCDFCGEICINPPNSSECEICGLRELHSEGALSDVELAAAERAVGLRESATRRFMIRQGRNGIDWRDIQRRARALVAVPV